MYPHKYKEFTLVDYILGDRGSVEIVTDGYYEAETLQVFEELHIDRERIWFTEKNSAKATMLYQLSDFTSLQARSNITKNYLEGRFGATTYTCPSLIHHLLAN